MRRAALVGTMIAFAALVFGLMQVTSAGANSAFLPALQETATPTVDEDTTPTVDADTTPTVDADTTPTVDADTTPDADTTATVGAAATAATTATATSLGQLPDTGASSGPNLTLLVIGTALLVFGAFAVLSLVVNRRNA